MLAAYIRNSSRQDLREVVMSGLTIFRQDCYDSQTEAGEVEERKMELAVYATVFTPLTDLPNLIITKFSHYMACH